MALLRSRRLGLFTTWPPDASHHCVLFLHLHDLPSLMATSVGLRGLLDAGPADSEADIHVWKEMWHRLLQGRIPPAASALSSAASSASRRPSSEGSAPSFRDRCKSFASRRRTRRLDVLERGLGKERSCGNLGRSLQKVVSKLGVVFTVELNGEPCGTVHVGAGNGAGREKTKTRARTSTRGDQHTPAAAVARAGAGAGAGGGRRGSDGGHGGGRGGRGGRGGGRGGRGRGRDGGRSGGERSTRGREERAALDGGGSAARERTATPVRSGGPGGQGINAVKALKGPQWNNDLNTEAALGQMAAGARCFLTTCSFKCRLPEGGTPLRASDCRSIVRSKEIV